MFQFLSAALKKPIQEVITSTSATVASTAIALATQKTSSSTYNFFKEKLDSKGDKSGAPSNYVNGICP